MLQFPIFTVESKINLFLATEGASIDKAIIIIQCFLITFKNEIFRFVLFSAFTQTFISINLGVEKTQLTMRRNQRELKNLKADYTAKAARLQYLSKRNEVEGRLATQGSKLQKPSDPAKTVKIVERYKQ